MAPNHRLDGPQVLIGEPAPGAGVGHIAWARPPQALPEFPIIRQPDRGLHQIVLIV